MYYKIKNHIKKNFPAGFMWARGVKDQLKTELKTLRQVGLLRILKQFLPSREKWRSELPVQTTSKFLINLHSIKSLYQGYEFKEGSYTVYLPLSAIMKDCADLKNVFPTPTGIKIVKHKGGLGASFAAEDQACKTYNFCAASHSELSLVYNLFYSLGMGPRLYDLIELQFNNGDTHVAYIMEHIDGQDPEQSECEDFVNKIKGLEEKNLVQLINWNGYKDVDFLCPQCNGNLIKEKRSQKLKYVDLQNFALRDYYSYVKSIALKAVNHSHFGDKSYLMGGQYLYQEIPGLNMVAKRSTAKRFQIWKDLLAQSRLTLQGATVIDIGCNLGLMSAQYLKAQATWVHGIDMPSVIEHAENILLTLGCTRFSLTGTELNEQTNLSMHIPDHLKVYSQPFVVSYLAVRKYFHWIHSLADIPWDFMLYEGHQEEDREKSRAYIEELNQLKPCHIIAESWTADANSSPRYVAIICSGARRS